MTAEVTRDLGRRELRAGNSSLTIYAVELTVIEYVKGSGPATLTVHQAVSSEDAKQVAYSLTAPPVGATGFFFLSPEKSWGVGGRSAAFGPDGRILEGLAGQPVLDREQAPPATLLAGKTMADVDREIRALLNSGD